MFFFFADVSGCIATSRCCEPTSEQLMVTSCKCIKSNSLFSGHGVRVVLPPPQNVCWIMLGWNQPFIKRISLQGKRELVILEVVLATSIELNCTAMPTTKLEATPPHSWLLLGMSRKKATIIGWHILILLLVVIGTYRDIYILALYWYWYVLVEDFVKVLTMADHHSTNGPLRGVTPPL